MSEVKDKLLSGAETLFMRYGFKSITMDDVSRELGVSKKTLYQFFVDKNDLVNQCVEHYLESMNGICCHVMEDKTLDAVSMVLKLTDEMSSIIKQVNPSSMYDLKKYFKSSWDKLEIDRRSFIVNTITENLRHGMEQGLYRDDINIAITTEIYVHLVGYLTNPESYAKSDLEPKTMHLEIVKYHLNSICTEKGRKVMNQHTSNQQKNN